MVVFDHGFVRRGKFFGIRLAHFDRRLLVLYLVRGARLWNGNRGIYQLAEPSIVVDERKPPVPGVNVLRFFKKAFVINCSDVRPGLVAQNFSKNRWTVCFDPLMLPM